MLVIGWVNICSDIYIIRQIFYYKKEKYIILSRQLTYIYIYILFKVITGPIGLI